MLSDVDFDGLFISDADKIDTAMRQVEGGFDGVLSWNGGDGAAHQVINMDGLTVGSSHGEVQMTGSNDITACGFGWVNA